MFDLHGITKASLLAHSYGTFYVSCLLKLLPERVHSMALIDPVCCCMWSGHLISNFVYKPAQSTTGRWGQTTAARNTACINWASHGTGLQRWHAGRQANCNCYNSMPAVLGLVEPGRTARREPFAAAVESGADAGISVCHPLPPLAASDAHHAAGLITWLISRDIHTAAAVSRNFFWTDVNLWPDEIPRSSLFVLSEKVRRGCLSGVSPVARYVAAYMY